MSVTFTRLESRLHLAAQSVLTVKGLPRELTAVGDTVYFARDSGKDGHLSFSELAAYNMETGVRSSVLRDHHKQFGRNQYTLSTDGARLLIKETPVVGPQMLWAYTPGSSHADLVLTASNIGVDNADLLRIGRTTYFRTATTGRTDTIWALPHTGVAKIAVDRSAFAKNRQVRQLMNWQGKLVITLTKDDIYEDSIYVSDGTTAGTTEMQVPAKKGFGHFSGVGVAGDNLIATTASSVGHAAEAFYDGDPTSRFAKYDSIPGSSGWTLRGSTGNLAIFNVGVGDQVLVVCTDFTTAGTRSIPNYGHQSGSRFFTLGDELYEYDYVPNAADDPEAVGGYVPPAWNDDPDYALSQSEVGPQLDGFLHLDFANQRTEVISQQGGMRDLVNVGGHAYFADGDFPYRISTDSAPDYTARHLWETDGTAVGTRELSSVFDGPVLADGKVLYTTSSSASPIMTPRAMKTGAIEGYLQRSDTTLAWNNFANQRVFIDLDGDRVFDKGEPEAFTNADGRYAFDRLKANVRYDVVVPSIHYVRASTSVLSVRVRAGKTTVQAFAYHDIARSSAIHGTIKYLPAPDYAGEPQGYDDVRPMQNARVWLDINGDSIQDPAEIVRTDLSGTFVFTGLRSRTYQLVALDGFLNYPDYRSGTVSVEPGANVQP